jgi:glycosyltransferase involved in cell wall biosynthesis
MPSSDSEKIRVLSLIEGQVVTSPANIVLRFAADSRASVDLRIVNLARGTGGHRNGLVAAAAEGEIPLTQLPDRGPHDLGLIPKLKRVIREHRPHIVQTNSVKSHFLVALLGKRRFGWLAFHHGYTNEDLKMRLYNRLDRISLRLCDEVVTVCNAFADELLAGGIAREKIRIIPNGIPPDFLERDPVIGREWRERFGISEGERVIVSAGRLSPEKGHTFLVDAAAKLLASGGAPKFRVLIAGSGLLEQRLAAQIRDLKLAGAVQLIGFQPDIKPLFQMADIFVLPSLSEGSPMVLLESMISHVPVITTDAGGIPETVTHDETALLVPAGDSERLAAALLDLLTHPERAGHITEAAYALARDSFNPQLYNSRVLASFKNVMSRKQRALGQRVQVPL